MNNNDKIMGVKDVEQGEVLLKVENLCQYFKSGKYVNKAVNNVSFDIKKGEVFGLVGESGCGKTTTGRSIIKLYDITSGNVYFKGVRVAAGTLSYKEEIKAARKRIKREIAVIKTSDVDNKSARIAEKRAELSQIIAKNNYEISRANLIRKGSYGLVENVVNEYSEKILEGEEINKDQKPLKIMREFVKLAKKKNLYKQMKRDIRIAKKTKLITKIQMIFQDPSASLNPRMTVKEIVSEGLVVNGIKDKEYLEQKVFEILELVGLVREHAGRYQHEFSGGQRQRIGIARAVIMNPDLIIADEPISALDVSIQAQVINLLNELREKLGLTILFIAHDLSVVKYFSDRIGVMYFGNMVELASSEELFAHPLHPYTQSLLSAIPQPDPHTEKQRVRITYNAVEKHDYSVDKPSFREIVPGHFVFCNDAEERKYKEEYNA